MNRILIFISVFCSSPFFSEADIPHFDVAKVKIENSIVYIKFESHGYLRNGDFCYYNYKNEYIGEVKDKVYNTLRNPRNYSFFKELHRINIKNLHYRLDNNLPTLYVFKHEIEIDPVANFNSVEIISVERGNMYGYVYSDDLCESDNEWLSKYKFQSLGRIELDNGFCDMTIYAIEGSTSPKKTNSILQKLQKAANENMETLKSELHALYKQRIIMLGFCSC